MSNYADYRYTKPGSNSGEPGRRLAGIFVEIVTDLPQVRSVCDLGCGNGFLAGLLLDKALDVTGVDASASGIGVARATLGSRGRFICASIDSGLGNELSGEFDALVSSDVVEHMYRPRDLVECAFALLRPGGWLVMGTPYHGYLKNLALSVTGRWDAHHGVDWVGGHIKFFSVRTLTRLAEAGGFSVERFEYFGRLPWLWKNMICVARKPARR